MPLVSLTRATLRSAEFGFLGVEVKTRTHTPRFWGEPWSAGLSVFDLSFSRPTRTSWLTVGKKPPRKRRRPCPGTAFTATLRVYVRAPAPVKGLLVKGLRGPPGGLADRPGSSVDVLRVALPHSPFLLSRRTAVHVHRPPV